jgi:hypothetical protein
VIHWIGRWLMAVAALHVVIAIVQYHDVLATVAQRGVFNTVAGAPEIGAVVWSLLFGAVAFIGGLAVSALERSGVALPKSLGWCLLVLAAVGAVLVPVSGFWLVFAPAIGILVRQPSVLSHVREP